MGRRVSPSIVLAMLAVVFTASGGAFAAGQITGAQIKDGSLTGRDIKNKSLTPVDFHGSTVGARGPQGFQGPFGPQGVPGTPGAPGLSNLTDVKASQAVAPGGNGSPTAFCPAGTTVVGSGFTSSVANVGFVEKFGTFVGGFFFNNTGITVTVEVQAICATVAGTTAVAASTTSGLQRLERMRSAARQAAGIPAG
jgi:hypothetical protein